MPRYTNLDGTTPDKSLGDILKWQVLDRITGKKAKRGASPRPFVTPRRPNDGSALARLSPHLTWIGHATFAMRLGGKMIVTDPIWSPRIQTIGRKVDPGVALDRMPRIDLVTISHSHYDHLDLPSVRRIAKANPEARYIVPKDVGEVVQGAGVDKAQIVELGWFETHREVDLSVTLVPAQHWSMRVPWDRNARLWGGFVYASNEGVAYHAGDTAFNEQVSREIASRLPRIDWAMLPIGAYDPPWFMQSQHMGPEEAGRTRDLLRARTLCAMHWGTFKLTDEPLSEPPERMREWWREQGKSESDLWIFDIGETRDL